MRSGKYFIGVMYLFFSAICFLFFWFTLKGFFIDRFNPSINVEGIVTGHEKSNPVVTFKVRTMEFSRTIGIEALPAIGEKIPLTIDEETLSPVKTASPWLLIIPLVMLVCGLSIVYVALEMFLWEGKARPFVIGLGIPARVLNPKFFVKWALVLFGSYFIVLGCKLIVEAQVDSKNRRVINVKGIEQKFSDYPYYLVSYDVGGKTYKRFVTCDSGLCGEEVEFTLVIDERNPGVPSKGNGPGALPWIIWSFVAGFFLLGTGLIFPKMKPVRD